jgi:hypothetical protein
VAIASHFSRIAGSVCDLCGLPLDPISGTQIGYEPEPRNQQLCMGCGSETFHFDRTRSFARYDLLQTAPGHLLTSHER